MHGTIEALGTREMGKTPYVPASFPLGEAWFVFVADYAWIRWDSNDKKFRIEREINDLGFKTFMPAEEKTKIKRKRKVQEITSAFGPYGFVKFDRERDEWGSLCPFDPKTGTGITGFYEIIKNENIPVRVPDAIVDDLMRMQDMGLFSDEPLKVGMQVEITEGPFAGIIGQIRSAKKHKRAQVLLKILGSVDIDPCFLRRI